MSATLAPPPTARRVATADLRARCRASRSAAGPPVLPVALARALAFTALAAWGALHWMSMLEPAEPGRGWLIVLVGLIAVGAMLGAGRLEGRRRTLVAVASIVPLAALMLLAGRVADELLLPDPLGASWPKGSGAGSTTCPACACRTAASTSGSAPCSRSAPARSSCSPRCSRSGRARAAGSGSRRSRCWC